MNAAAWGAASTALDLVSFAPFVLAAARGRARPSRIAWSMWAAEYVVLLAASQAAAQGGTAAAWITAGEAAGCASLAAFGWARKGPADDAMPLWAYAALGVGTCAALAAWPLVSPSAAVILAATVDLVAGAVNAWKTWRSPAGENLASWRLFGAACVVDLPVARGILLVWPLVGLATAVMVLGAAHVRRAALRYRAGMTAGAVGTR